MADSDLIKLYSGRILELAASIPHQGRLSAPMGSAKKRSPLCGSTVTVDVVVKDGRITEFAQDVKACALGQASASVLGRVLVGKDRGIKNRRPLKGDGGQARICHRRAGAGLAAHPLGTDARHRWAKIAGRTDQKAPDSVSPA